MSRPSPISASVRLLLLLTGSVVFAFPFVWMVSTSLKVERELFREDFEVIPGRPEPRPVSPYYASEDEEPLTIDAGKFALIRPIIRDRVRELERTLPLPGDGVSAVEPVTAQLLSSFARRTPTAIWAGDEATLRAYVGQELSTERVAEAAAEAFRRLEIGSLRARSGIRQDQELIGTTAADGPAGRWTNLTPSVSALEAASERTLHFARVRYDLNRGDHFALQYDARLQFPAAELDRVLLRLRPDDTWHELHLTVECAGQRWVSERPVSLADTRWKTVTWQKPSADDNSTKIKTWLVLVPAGEGGQFDHGPNGARISLEVRRVSPMQASFAKARYNYQRVADQIPFWRYVRVSFLLVVLNIAFTLFSSSLVAYAFARIQWPGRDAMFLVMLGTMMIPGQVTMVPHFLIWKSLGAFNTLTPLYAGAALGNAFFIFMMRQFLKGIPPDLEEAARLDGCGFLRIYWHVMLPLVKPSLVAIAIFTFMATWNDFLGPLLYVADQRLYPLAFGLYALSVQVDANPVLTMAASVLMTVPVIVVFLLAQRSFVQGITLTGMKG